MKYPFVSFSLAFLIFFFAVILLSFSFLKKTSKEIKLIPATVEIDSVMLSEVGEKNSEVKIVKKFQEEKLQENSLKQKKLQNSHPQNSQVKKITEKLSEKNREENYSDSKNKVLILYGPLPKIPDHLRDEAFNSFAMARFYINEDGSSKVELIKECNNPELNYLLLKNLAKWKFAKSDKNSVQDIRVNFRVE